MIKNTRKGRRLPNEKSCAVGNRRKTIPCDTALYSSQTDMAQRRMFSPQIVGSDAFLEMPTSSRELYFQFGMYADDDGFVSPKRIMRMIGAQDDDLKMLLAKSFVLPFENGVVVVKHWKMNNLVRKDWYRPSQYTEQKKILFVKDNGAYTFDSSQGVPLVNEMLTTRSRSIGKDRLGNNTSSNKLSGPEAKK